MFERAIPALIYAVLLSVTFAPAKVQAQGSQPSTDFVLQDGAPIKLRVTRDVSSANAKVGDKVDLEAAEDIRVGGVTIIRKGSPASGTVTAVQSARRLARGGKLAIKISSVQMADGESALLRQSTNTTGEEQKGGMAAEAIFGVGPFALFREGEDAFLERDTILTAYINGTMHLDRAQFNAAAVSLSSTSALVRVKSHPAGAEISVDGNAVGTTPLELKLAPGSYTIRISKAGWRTWERTVTLSFGKSDIDANLYPSEINLR